MNNECLNNECLSRECLNTGYAPGEHNYGVDLLRLILMFLVCMTHVLVQGGAVGACTEGSLNWRTFWFLETIGYCSMDGFALISGYMAPNRPQRYDRLAHRWLQAFFYSFIVTAVLMVIGVKEVWSTMEMVQYALPVTFVKFWYFTAYFALFFAMPLLNRYLFAVEEMTAKKALVILFVLFSCMGFFDEPFRTQGGNSAIWLMILYCIGVLAKRVHLFESRKTVTLILWFAICILSTWGIHMFLGISRITTSVSPTIVLGALLLVVLFSRVRLKGKIISKLSPLAFGIYLFHLNPVVWEEAIGGRFAYLAEKNAVLGVLLVLAFSSCIFVAGATVEALRRLLDRFMGIPGLCTKIARLIERLLTRVCTLRW